MTQSPLVIEHLLPVSGDYPGNARSLPRVIVIENRSIVGYVK